MKKELDYEEIERRKYVAIDFIYNIVMIVVFLLAFCGLFAILIESDIDTKLICGIFLLLFFGFIFLWSMHKDSRLYFTVKRIENKINEPKFKYLTKEQKQQIITEIHDCL